MNDLYDVSIREDLCTPPGTGMWTGTLILYNSSYIIMWSSSNSAGVQARITNINSHVNNNKYTWYNWKGNVLAGIACNLLLPAHRVTVQVLPGLNGSHRTVPRLFHIEPTVLWDSYKGTCPMLHQQTPLVSSWWRNDFIWDAMSTGSSSGTCFQWKGYYHTGQYLISFQ